MFFFTIFSCCLRMLILFKVFNMVFNFLQAFLHFYSIFILKYQYKLTIIENFNNLNIH